MVKYQLELSLIAKAQFTSFDETLRLRIVDKIRYFLENDIKPEALEGNFAGSYKLRVGDYRVIYVIENEKIMFVRRIGHRSTVYRDLARD
jgi:mRNA interferase RelE/StbE